MSAEACVILYAISQILYFVGFGVFFYFITLPIDWVNSSEEISEEKMPLIVLAYPVLNENMATMAAALTALNWIDYPKSKYRVIAIPNHDDHDTIRLLIQLQGQFPFLEILEVPPTTDSKWNFIWESWSINEKAYWHHYGCTNERTDLPPKKTRQLIYMFYQLVQQIGTDWILDYIDADSLVPTNHFKDAARGLQHYDILQSTNAPGNLLDSMPATLHSYDHLCWDGLIYPHMSSNGHHPYYVLGKGLFYRAKDLFELGGFNPWITIEDPEIGLRFWANGKKLGIIEDPLIEEVPRTIMCGFIQRFRWMCGFFQTLSKPLKLMGLNFRQRMRARINILPDLSMPVNIIGLPTGIYVLLYVHSLDFWLLALSIINIGLYVVEMAILYINAWKRTKLVLNSFGARVWYMFRVNPVSLFLYWTLWTIPIMVGFIMFLADLGQKWRRTEKYGCLKPSVKL